MTKSKIINMKTHIKFLLLSKLFITIVIFSFIFVRTPHTQDLHLIQDAEIENTILEWILPIYKIAELNANSVKIYLINDDQINAFVAGGQNIFINTGLILKASSPNALIGVLAHEIGHIAGGHLIRKEMAIEQTTATVIVTTIITAGLLVANTLTNADVSGATSLVTLGPSIAQRTFLKHNRENEKTADISAIKYLNAVNRPIKPLMNILKEIGKKELLHEDRQDPYLRTHPFIRDRINTIEANIKNNENLKKEKPKEKIQYDRMVAKIIAFTQPPGRTLLLYPKNDDSLVSHYARAIAYLRMPDLKKGLKEINYLIKNNPKDPYFPELLGQMLFENGKIKKAITALKVSSDLLPSDPTIMLSLARAQIEANEKNQTVSALKNIKKIIKIDTENILAWRLMSIAEERLENHGLANLAAAEEAYRMGEFRLAIKFAEKSRKIFKEGTPNDLRAQDIIFFASKRIK